MRPMNTNRTGREARDYGARGGGGTGEGRYVGAPLGLQWHGAVCCNLLGPDVHAAGLTARGTRSRTDQGQLVGPAARWAHTLNTQDTVVAAT